MTAATDNVVSINPAAEESEADVRTQVRVLMDIDKRLSQARIAKESGISSATVSQYLAGSYNGDNTAIEAKLQRWIDTTHAQRAQAEALPSAPEYISTPTAERVIGGLRYAQIAGDIAVIYGGAGLGKSTAIIRYATSAPNVWHVTMTPATASVVTALEEIVDVLNLGGVQGGAAKLHRAIVKRVRGTQGLLVIDESQHLSVAALDQIRGIHDATGIGIALVGNEAAYARITGGNRAAYLDRLFSRIGKRVRLTRSTTGDINALLTGWNIEHADCRAQLVDIASKPGALRGLTKVLRLASMYAAAAKRKLCCDDVRAAWKELGGAE